MNLPASRSHCFAGYLALFLGGVLALGANAAVAWDNQGVGIDLSKLQATGCDLIPRAGGNQSYIVTFKSGEWPSASIKANPSWDWSNFGYLVLELENPGERPLSVGVRIDDDVAADGVQHCRTANVQLAAGSREAVAIGIGIDPRSLGMRGLPGPATARRVESRGAEDFQRSHIVAFQIFMHKPEQPESVIVHGVRLLPSLPEGGIVDRFGQYMHGDWPGKLHNESELASRKREELKSLATAPALPERNRFGGWSAGPELRATGFFRTEQLDGIWWLVDPEGRPFFSSGIDCVRMSDATVITGREKLFTWLPEGSDPLARFFSRFDRVHSGPVTSGRSYDFYLANLSRKYGSEFEDQWTEVTLKRLPAWGFNTIGNWSSSELYRNGKVPYVATGSIGGEHDRISSGSDYWGKMHDPFDPRFAADVERSLAPLTEQVRNDPWCIGYFVDNELSWGGFDIKDQRGRLGLALGALGAGPPSPARHVLIADLKQKYGSIEQLNAAWKTSFESWPALETKPFQPTGPLSEALESDLRVFIKKLASTYFQTIRDVLRRHDPQHLYMGCRFAWKTPEAIEAAVEHCDVVSFNIYRPRVDQEQWGFLKDLGKPCIIGEFHVGALDRGMFHTGLVSASSQEERARIFREYVESVIDNPALVGCHWFQYVDQPVTGRSLDGENYNIGFVTITDTPYAEMVEAARAVHRNMYGRRVRGAHQP